jgi:hypothetical protein
MSHPFYMRAGGEKCVAIQVRLYTSLYIVYIQRHIDVRVS